VIPIESLETVDRAPVTDPGDDARQEQPAELLPPLDVDDDGLRRGLLGILFISDEPVTVAVLAATLGLPVERIEAGLREVGQRLAGLGIDLIEVAGGWRLMTAPSARPVLERWIIGARHGRLTQAALETLAVVAYRQPIARITIGEIRGVNPDGALRSLMSRGLIAEVGREDGPGQAVLFGTTGQFLERMGLRSLDELPPLPPFLPDGPAPDEPDAGGLAALRKRLRDGSQRLGNDPSAPDLSRGDRTDQRIAAAGRMLTEDDDDEEAMAPPVPRARRTDEGEIIDLSDRLEQAARNAMGRLRQVKATQADAEAAVDAQNAAREAAAIAGDDADGASGVDGSPSDG